MKKDKIDEIITEALKKQHHMVGAIYSPELCKKDGWFLEYQWTKERQNEFKAWLVSVLVKKLQISKKRAEREASYFVFNYGWKES